MIKNPLAMWVGLWDQVCNPSNAEFIYQQAEPYISHYNVVPWHGHGTWGMAQSPVIIADFAKGLDWQDDDGPPKIIGFLQ